MSIDELQISLMVHEQRLKINQEKEEEHGLKIGIYGYGCINKRGRGRGGLHGRGRGRLGRDQIQCYKCHKIGQYQSECPSWKQNYVNFAEFDESEELLLIAQKKDTKTNNQV